MARKKPVEESSAAPAKPAKPSALLDTRARKPTDTFFYHCDWHAYRN